MLGNEERKASKNKELFWFLLLVLTKKNKRKMSRDMNEKKNEKGIDNL